NAKVIKAGEILLVVKFHRLFHVRGGFCPNLFLYSLEGMMGGYFLFSNEKN
ncbi:hypothetical protein J2S08_003767, partial [Bacillus chungangensis]|nr:hypothetical protein [Bacillus chungangensis]